MQGDFDLSNLPAEGAPTSATSATAASANGYASAEATAAENMDVEGAVEVKLESKQPASTAAPQQQKPRAPRREWVGEMEADDDLAAALAKARAIAVQKSLAAQSTDSGASKALELLQTHAPDLEDRVADPDSIGTYSFVAFYCTCSCVLSAEVDTEGRRADGSLVFNSTVEFATRLQATLNEKARQRAETAARDMEHAVAMAEANEAISMTSSRRPRSVGGASSQGGEEKKMDVQVQDVDDEDLSDDDFDFDPEDMKRAEESDVDDEDSQLGFLHHQPLASKGLR